MILLAVVASLAGCGPSHEDEVAKSRVCECLAAHQELEAMPATDVQRAGVAERFDRRLDGVRDGLTAAEPARVRELVAAECPAALSTPCGATLSP